MNLAELKWPDIDSLSRDVPIVIPVAALEQHGHHLPLFTDSMLLGEVVRRVSSVLNNRVLFAPLMWWGNSHHHMDYPGTMSASPRIYLDILNEMVENLLAHQFRRIVLINGHGGNITPGKQAIFELRQRHRHRQELLLLFTTYWEHAKPNVGNPELVQTQMGHACEWETSMILHLAPHLVKDFSQLEDIPSGFGFEPAYRGWTMKYRSGPGHIGSPRFATAAKGAYLFETFAQGVAQWLERVLAWNQQWKISTIDN